MVWLFLTESTTCSATNSVFVGMSSDTADFAVDSIERWWRYTGKYSYPNTDRLLILADGGGSNGARNKAWKVNLQEKLCDRHNIAVTVCHYPTGASKWNLIEHRLFSEISKNWAGRPLDSYETIVNYIRTTTNNHWSQGQSLPQQKDIRNWCQNR